MHINMRFIRFSFIFQTVAETFVLTYLFSFVFTKYERVVLLFVYLSALQH